MMKVLYMTHETELNGAQKSLLEFLPVLREKGVEPIVVLPGQGRLKEELDKIGIDTQIVSYRVCVYFKEQKCGFRYYMNYVIGNCAAVWKLIQIIRKENIAIIHSNSLAVDVGAIAAFLLRRLHVWHMREYLEEDFGFRTIMPSLDDYLIKKASCCIAIAKGIKRKYERKYCISAVLMYNGINSLNYYSEIRAMNTNGNDMKLLLAGSLIKGKGQRDAINAVKILSQKGRGVRLYIVGDGVPDYTLNLKKYVEKNNLHENVIFVPYIADLRQMRRECDAVLVCSRMEAFGRVTAEAMMAGKIVIGASTGGTAELIGDHEERGYLYTWGNSQELADKIDYVRTHPDEVYQKEKEAQKFIVSLTDMETYTERLAHIYRSFLSHSNSAKRENEIV